MTVRSLALAISTHALLPFALLTPLTTTGPPENPKHELPLKSRSDAGAYTVPVMVVFPLPWSETSLVLSRP